MGKYIIGLVVVVACGAVLVTVCIGPFGDPGAGGEDQTGRSGQEKPPPTSIQVQEGVAGPNVSLKQGYAEWTIWARINAADSHGISIDGVQNGDRLTIETISGVAYFSGRSGWWQLLSVVYGVTPGVVAPIDSIASNMLTSLRETLPDDEDGGSRPRDGYGRDLDDGSGRFAEEEGGIVICMPVARGPMYAYDDNHFTRRQNGREHKPESKMPGKCFPAARHVEEYTMLGNGVLHIYAFDHNYRDNSGSYEIKFRIDRPNTNSAP